MQHPDDTAPLDLRDGNHHPGLDAILAGHLRAHPARQGGASVDQGVQLGPVLRTHEIQHRATQAAGRAFTGQGRPGLVQENQPPLGIHLEDGFGQQLDPPPHAVLGLDQGLDEALGRLNVQVGGQCWTAVIHLARHGGLPAQAADRVSSPRIWSLDAACP